MELEDRTLLSGTPLGVESLVNTTTPNSQQTFAETTQAVAADASGNYVVAWSSLNQDGAGWGIYAQRFDSAGAAQGGEFLVNTATGTNEQYAAVAMDANGDFVVVWSTDASGDAGVRAQRFDANGIAQGGEIQVNDYTADDQTWASVAMDDNGNFVITWSSINQDGGGWGVYAERYNSLGVGQGDFLVNTTTAGDQMHSRVAMDADGDFVITWETDLLMGTGFGIFGQRYNSSGAAQLGEFLINTTTAGDQRRSAVEMDAAGNFVVTWTSAGQDGSGGGIYGQRYDASGTALAGEFLVNATTSGDQDYSRISMSANGDFVVTWSSLDQDSAGTWGVYGQKYAASGAVEEAEFRVNTTTAGDQRYSGVVMTPNNTAVFVWSGNGTGDADGVFMQCYNFNDAPIVTTTLSDLAYVENAGAVAVDSGLTVIDSDNANLTGATITISGNYVNGEDTLSFTNQNGITGSWNAASGILTLSGASSVGNYQAALRSITYTNNSDTPSTATRTVSFAVSDVTATGNAATRDITVTAVNDAPVVGEIGSGSGLSFDGDDFVVIAADPSLSVSDRLTMEAWIFPMIGGDSTQIIMNKEGEYEVARFSDGTIRWAFANTDPAWTWYSTGYVAAALQWTHIAVTYDNGLVNTYANGALVHTYAGAGLIADIYPALNDLTIGGRQNAVTQRFVGLIDEVRVWNTARTQPEISSTMNQSLAGNEAGLAGSWTFDEGRGTTAADQTASGNTAALGNGVAANQPGWVNPSMDEDGILVIPAAGVLRHADDIDGDALVPLLVSNGSNGNVVINLDGSFTYTPGPNFVGVDTFTYKVNDGTTDSNTATISVTVSAANDAPTNAIPVAQNTNRNTTLVFSTANGNAISISDADAGGGNVEVTLTATQGTLTLGATTGLGFLTGDGATDATTTFTGTIADINAALQGLAFNPTAGFYGAAGLTITTDDLGNSGGAAQSDTDVLAITVQTSVGFQAEDYLSGSATGAGFTTLPEVGALGGRAITTNGQTLDFTMPPEYVRYSITFPDAGATDDYHLYVRYRLMVDWTDDDSAWATNPLDADPTQAANWDLINDLNQHAAGTGYQWIDLASNATPGIDLVAAYNSVLAGVHSFAFGGRENGFVADAFVFSTGFNLDTTIVGRQMLDAAVNNRPVIATVPGAANFTEGGSAAVIENGLSISDVDDSALVSATVRISANFVPGQDTLRFTNQSGIIGSWNAATGVLSLTGTATVSQYQTALRSVTYTNTSDNPSLAPRTIAFTANDGTIDSGLAMRNLAVTPVNDAPAVAVPGQQTSLGPTLVLSSAQGNAITLYDSDAQGAVLELTLAATNGTLTLAATTGISFIQGTAAGSSQLILHGTLSDLNRALDGLSFQATGASAQLGIVLSDLGNSGLGGAASVSQTIAIEQSLPPPPPTSPTPPDGGENTGGDANSKDNSIEQPDNGNGTAAAPPLLAPAPRPPDNSDLDRVPAARAAEDQSAAGLITTTIVTPNRTFRPGAAELDSADYRSLIQNDAARAKTAPLDMSRLLADAAPEAMLFDELREVHEALDSVFATNWSYGAIAGLGALSAGYVLWGLQAGSLVTSALSSLPVWGSFDPLPVLEFWERDSKRKGRQQLEEEDPFLQSEPQSALVS